MPNSSNEGTPGIPFMTICGSYVGRFFFNIQYFHVYYPVEKVYVAPDMTMSKAKDHLPLPRETSLSRSRHVQGG